MPIASDNPPDVFTLDQFKGLNQQSQRGSIDDQEEWFDENLFAIGPGNLRSCWGPSPSFYTVPAGYTIRRIFCGFYGQDITDPQGAPPSYSQPPPGRKCWVFYENGTAAGMVDEVDLDTHQVTTVGQIWAPISPKWWASAKVWRPRWIGSTMGQVGGVLFGSPQGLYAWDGQNLYSPGGPAPDWLTNALENPFPSVTTMPSGLPGIYAMEVYSGRLWVAGKDVISFTSPENGADFSEGTGGGSFGYYGDKLVHDYMDLAASSGYLYVFGDSSTDMISNVQMSGQGTATDPYLTNFLYMNVDPQVGQRFPRVVGHWGRYFTLYNGAGIFLMQGGDANEIGQKTLNIYNTLDTSEFYPTMSPCTMFGTRVMLFNGMFTDPWGRKRTLLLMWHGTFWSIASQHYNLTHIAPYEDNSVLTAYGTDGTNLYRLFDSPDPTLIKRLSTKALRGDGPAQLVIKNFKRVYLEFHDCSGDGWTRSDSQTVVSVPRPPRGVSFTGSITTGDGGVQGGKQDIGFDLTSGKKHSIEPFPISGGGIWAYVDLESISPDFIIERLHVTNEGRTLFGA